MRHLTMAAWMAISFSFEIRKILLGISEYASPTL